MNLRPHDRTALAAACVAGLLAVVVPFAGGVAEATAPVFTDPPTRVYTAVETNLAFTGGDPITGQQRDIVVDADGDDSTCDVKSPGDDDWEGNCMGAQIEILQPNRGTLTINDANLDYSTSGQSGDSAFNVQGKLADLQNALASLVYVPPGNDFETTDSTPVTLRVTFFNAQPAPDSASIEVDIRVEGDNAWPDLTEPTDDPYEVNVNETFEIIEPDTEVFTVTDEDADQDEASDYLLGVAWVDCGMITMPASGAGFVGDPNELLDPGFIDESFDPTLLPGMVPDNLSFTTDPNTGGASAIGWLAGIDADNEDFSDNFNTAMRWFQFLAPSTPGTCTLTVVVTDLGNNGMPLAGEIPSPGIDWGSVEFDVVDPNAPETTTTVPDLPDEPGDDTTTTTTTTTTEPEQPGDDTTTTSTTTEPEQPGDDTTTTSTTTTTTTTTTTVPCVTPAAGGPCRTTTTTSTTVPGDTPGDPTTTTTDPGDTPGDPTTTSTTDPGDTPGDPTTTSVPVGDPGTPTTTLPGEVTTLACATTTTSAPATTAVATTATTAAPTVTIHISTTTTPSATIPPLGSIPDITFQTTTTGPSIVSIPNLSIPILSIPTTTLRPSIGSIGSTPILTAPSITVRPSRSAAVAAVPCETSTPGGDPNPGGGTTPGGDLTNVLPQTGTSAATIVVLAVLLVAAGCPLLLVRRRPPA